jgi:hypothetical protein
MIGFNVPNPSFDHHHFLDFGLITLNPQPTTLFGVIAGLFFSHDLVVKTF